MTPWPGVNRFMDGTLPLIVVALVVAVVFAQFGAY